MSFIDSYKRLEKLCNEMYGANYGLSAYIDDMLNNPAGAKYIEDWNQTLKQLKHYRWIRNQIVHEPNCNEENMCAPDDSLWLDKFYSRILASNDPLSLYRKSGKQPSTNSSEQVYFSSKVCRKHKKRVSKHNKYWNIVILIWIFIVAVVILYMAHKML